VVTSVTREPDTGVDGLPLDAETFTDTITVVQLMELSRSTRADIDARTNELVSHMRELLAERMWEGDDDAKNLFKQAYRHLELSGRPTKETSAFDAFQYMRETATLTFALLKVYVAKSEDQGQ
jgi:hypothetical protein